MWANGATLDAPKGLPAVLGCLLSFREEMKNVGQVLLRSPWIVAVCAIALAIMVGVGIWAVRQGADSEVSRREAAAVALALEAAALLETSIALEALPAKTLGIFVQDTPDYPTLGAKFDQVRRHFDPAAHTAQGQRSRAGAVLFTTRKRTRVQHALARCNLFSGQTATAVAKASHSC